MPLSDPILIEIKASSAEEYMEPLIHSSFPSFAKYPTDVEGTNKPVSPSSDHPFFPPASNMGREILDVNLGVTARPKRSSSSSVFPLTPQFSAFTSTAMVNVTEVRNAITHHTHVVNNILSDTKVGRLPKELGSLGILHYFLYIERSDQGDLETAIKHLGTAINLIEQQSPENVDLPALFYCRGCALHFRFLLISHSLHDLDEAIQHLRQAVELNPEDSAPDAFPNKSQCHNDLGSALQARFERLGHVVDIDHTIIHLSNALELNNSPITVSAITSNLGIAYQSRFDRLGEQEDLDNATQNLQQSIELTWDSDSSHPGRLNNLGLSLQCRFELEGCKSDLSNAITMFQEAVEVTFSAHPEWLSNLGTAYRIRAELNSDSSDLVIAITHLKLAIELAETEPSDYHGNLPKYLAKLAACFATQIHLNHQGGYNYYNIDKAISLFEEALAITPEDREAERSTLLLRYGDALQTRYDQSPNSTRDEEDVSKAIEQFQTCSKLRYGPIMARLRGAIRWAQLAHRTGELYTALTAYKDAIELLPQAAWIGQSVTSRRHILATHPGTLAADAAACAIQKGVFSKAVELLEQGRTIFWMQALQLRTDLTELSEVNPALACELQTTAEELEPGTFEDSLHTHVRANQSSAERSAQHHRRLAERWQDLVDEVRKLRGWQEFLKPQPFSQLQSAAKCGPVIIANASSHRCDALIVLEKGPPLHVPLTTASFHTLTELGLDMDPTASYGLPTEFKAALRTLWNSVIAPISARITMLFPHENERTRVWWCPTGPLTFLPLHMAGASAEALKTSTDDFIPSYTVNLGSLIRARMAHTIHPRLLLVGLAHTPDLPRLPGVDVEIKNISERALHHNIPFEALRQEATMTAVLGCLPEASWAHFACHGFGGSKPFNSALALHDGVLRLATIVQHRLPIADFAFLSACQTATGLKDLPDEALHIAAGLQFAGFRSVIGTMWSVLDKVAGHVTDEVYSHLWRDEHPDSTEATEALDIAVRKLVNDSEPDVERGAGYLRPPLTREERDRIFAAGRLIPFVHFGI